MLSGSCHTKEAAEQGLAAIKEMNPGKPIICISYLSGNGALYNDETRKYKKHVELINNNKGDAEVFHLNLPTTPAYHTAFPAGNKQLNPLIKRFEDDINCVILSS